MFARYVLVLFKRSDSVLIEIYNFTRRSFPELNLIQTRQRAINLFTPSLCSQLT